MAKPTDQEIAQAFGDIHGDVCSARLAASVLEEYASMEFRAGHDRNPKAAFAYTLTNQQVDGILYMVGHVRDLVAALDIAFDKAFGQEAPL